MAAGGDLEAARGGAMSVRGPATVDYVAAAAVGFEIVPAVVRARLVAARLIGSTALSAGCEGLRTRRRANDTYYQSGEAWWGDATRAVLFTVRRELTHRGGDRYAPRSPWDVSGTIYYLGDVGGPERSTWQFDTATSKARNASRPVTTDEPLDLLPPDVAAPVRGGRSDVWREHDPDSAAEHLSAIRTFDDRVLLLGASRTAPNVRALTSAAWTLTTLDAPITRREPFGFTIDDEAIRARRDQLGGSDVHPPPLPPP